MNLPGNAISHNIRTPQKPLGPSRNNQDHQANHQDHPANHQDPPEATRSLQKPSGPCRNHQVPPESVRACKIPQDEPRSSGANQYSKDMLGWLRTLRICQDQQGSAKTLPDPLFHSGIHSNFRDIAVSSRISLDQQDLTRHIRAL